MHVKHSDVIGRLRRLLSGIVGSDGVAAATGGVVRRAKEKGRPEAACSINQAQKTIIRPDALFRGAHDVPALPG